MAAVGLGYDEAMAAIRDLECGRHFFHPGHLELSCFNSRTNHTISGEMGRVDALVAKLNSEKVFGRRLKVEVGYHSRYMQPIADEYARLIGDLGKGSTSMDTSAPKLYSSTMGEATHVARLQTATYWVENLLLPVQFRQSVTAMFTESRRPQDDGNLQPFTDFLEIGPHRGLKGSIRQIADDLGLHETIQYHSLMEQGSSDIISVLGAAGGLFSRGIAIDVPLVNVDAEQSKPKMLTGLPSYPFNHSKEYWPESRLSKAFGHRKHGRHEVLGTPVAHNSPHDSMWHHWLRLADLPWLEDHKVGDAILFPAAGIIAMAIEASCQVAGDSRGIKGFRLRHVSLHAALHIPTDGSGVETYLHLHSVRQAALGAEATSPEPKEFTLCSVSRDNEWQEHCRGTILVEHEETATPVDGGLEARELASHCDSRVEQATVSCRPRITSAMLYMAFAERNLNFGETFQTLTHIYMDDPMTPRMVRANVRPNFPYDPDQVRKSFVIHPTMLDGILQVGLSPMLIGHGAKDACQPWVPVYIDELWISVQTHDAESIIPVRSDAVFHGRNEVQSSCVAVAKESRKPLILVNGLVIKTAASLSPSTTSDMQDSRQVAWNTDWKPDVSLLSRPEVEAAFRLDKDPDPRIYTDLEECNTLSCLYAERALHRNDYTRTQPNGHVRSDPTIDLPLEVNSPGDVPSHLYSYVNLMERLVAEWKRQNNGDGLDSIETLEARLAGRGTINGKLVMAVGTELQNVLDGTADPLEILFSTSLAEEFYLGGYGVDRTSAQLAGYLDVLAHKNPLMRMLEIGAGTGGTAKPVLDILASRYRRYVFTDVSSAFLEKAKERFSTAERVDYRVLDIEHNPSTQGFEMGTYDVLIATHVLHATKNILTTLQNCLALLKPGGKLLFTENTQPLTMMSNFVFGLFPGWWKSEDKDCGAGPLLTTDAWELYVIQSGFARLDAVLPDYADEKHHMSLVLVCSAPESSDKESPDSALQDG